MNQWFNVLSPLWAVADDSIALITLTVHSHYFLNANLEIASETRVGEKRDIPVQFARSWNKNTRKRKAANSVT